jgi:hypothetical protein
MTQHVAAHRRTFARTFDQLVLDYRRVRDTTTKLQILRDELQGLDGQAGKLLWSAVRSGVIPRTTHSNFKLLPNDTPDAVLTEGDARVWFQWVIPWIGELKPGAMKAGAGLNSTFMTDLRGNPVDKDGKPAGSRRVYQDETKSKPPENAVRFNNPTRGLGWIVPGTKPASVMDNHEHALANFKRRATDGADACQLLSDLIAMSSKEKSSEGTEWIATMRPGMLRNTMEALARGEELNASLVARRGRKLTNLKADARNLKDKDLREKILAILKRIPSN